MIFLDANYFLRALAAPTSPEIEEMAKIAQNLFRAVARGEQEVTTSEAVLAEVAFILTSPRQYGLSAEETAARLAPILRLPNLKLPAGSKSVYLRALDVWASHPRLSFVDALTAATVEHGGLQLATFDHDFDGLPGITRYDPGRNNGMP